ncbi:hypothetical protein DICA1_A02652 [Diutina catenulata]
MMLDYGRFGCVHIPFSSDLDDSEMLHENGPGSIGVNLHFVRGHIWIPMLYHEQNIERTIKTRLVEQMNRHFVSENEARRGVGRELIRDYLERWGSLSQPKFPKGKAKPSPEVLEYAKSCEKISHKVQIDSLRKGNFIQSLKDLKSGIKHLEKGLARYKKDIE